MVCFGQKRKSLTALWNTHSLYCTLKLRDMPLKTCFRLLCDDIKHITEVSLQNNLSFCCVVPITLRGQSLFLQRQHNKLQIRSTKLWIHNQKTLTGCLSTDLGGFMRLHILCLKIERCLNAHLSAVTQKVPTYAVYLSWRMTEGCVAALKVSVRYTKA